jgi:hypothetical protein
MVSTKVNDTQLGLSYLQCQVMTAEASMFSKQYRNVFGSAGAL